MLKDKYTIETEKTKEENKDKIVISNDAYANCEMLEELTTLLRRRK